MLAKKVATNKHYRISVKKIYAETSVMMELQLMINLGGHLDDQATLLSLCFVFADEAWLAAVLSRAKKCSRRLSWRYRLA